MFEKPGTSYIADKPVLKIPEVDFPRDFFKIVSEITTDGLAIIENGRFVLINDQLLITFKTTRKKLIGNETLNFVHKDDTARAVKELQLNRKVFYELRLKRGDGVYIYSEVRAHPVFYNGKKCRLLIVKDITQRKIAERLFANYLNIIEAFPEAICIHDKSGKILFANSSALKLVSAQSADEVKGRNIMEFILLEYHSIVKENKPKLEKLEAVTRCFVKIKLAAENTVKNIEASIIPVEWGEEPVAMVICHDSSIEEQIEKSEIARQVMQSVNEHLHWEITRHRDLEAKLKKMIDEKEWLLKEVNHRVKNNMQIITSILNLQINQMHNIKLIPVMREFQNRFYALSSIYSSLYNTGTSEEIEISAYLKDLANNLFVSYSDLQKRLLFHCNTSSIFLDYDQAITCGLIVNELVSNSIKHAFRGGIKGEIALILKQKGKNIYLEISDNGMGMSKKEGKKPPLSLGLQLVDSLITQLNNGKLKMSSGSNGTKYNITFTTDRA